MKASKVTGQLEGVDREGNGEVLTVDFGTGRGIIRVDQDVQTGECGDEVFNGRGFCR